ncbi:C40 family peptidase [Mesorhizobium sp. M0983]|uniref:C40 family peptidase n=1 Tax=Mesorhizobium sp. M0983 TaxID=2957040 RepID=UPI003335F34C
MSLMTAPGDLRWTQAFIGLPFADKGRDWSGCDCWGFVRLVHAEHAGNDLPSYAGLGAAERREIAGIVAREAQSALWLKVETPQALDILWFRRGRLDAHCGLYLRPGLMMHMVEEDCSKIERFDDGSPWQHRLTGVYRWRGGA